MTRRRVHVKRIHGSNFLHLTEDDFISLTDLAASEGVKETTAYRWILDHGYRPYCRKIISHRRCRLFVPIIVAEAYAAARGAFPVAAKRPAGWVGVKIAAERLRISEPAVHRQAHRGHLPAVRVGRRVYFNIHAGGAG